MIEKLNFYDIFGYLLPGIVFATLLWLPFGLFLHIWPSDLSGALIVVVLSYIIGHILQGYAVRLLPFSATTDKFGRERHPADLMLDVNSIFTAETKSKINQLSQKYFNLNLEPQDYFAERPGHQETISTRRRDAFFQARSVLLKDRKTSYWEQFEGFSALMRNVSAACAVAASYFLGWGVAFSRKAGVFFGLSQADSWAKWGAVFILFFAVKVMQLSLPPSRKSEEQSIREENDYKQEQKNIAIALRLSLLCISFLAGMLLCLGRKDLQPPGGPFIMLGMALAAVIVSIKCFVASMGFAWLFAENIWREFAQIDKPSPSAPPDLV